VCQPYLPPKPNVNYFCLGWFFIFPKNFRKNVGNSANNCTFFWHSLALYYKKQLILSRFAPHCHLVQNILKVRCIMN
jgi:hypothetical protein